MMGAGPGGASRLASLGEVGDGEWKSAEHLCQRDQDQVHNFAFQL